MTTKIFNDDLVAICETENPRTAPLAIGFLVLPDSARVGYVDGELLTTVVSQFVESGTQGIFTIYDDVHGEFSVEGHIFLEPCEMIVVQP